MQKFRDITRPLSLETDVIKKRDRNGSSLAATPKMSVPYVAATEATQGIVTAKGRTP